MHAAPGQYRATGGEATFSRVGSPIKVDDAYSGSTSSEPVLTAHEPSDTLEATGAVGLKFGGTANLSVVRAGSERATARKQEAARRVTVVRTVGPQTRALVAQMISAIEAERHNAPPTGAALAGLKELHRALGDLIERAEQGKPLATAMERVKKLERHIGRTIKNGAAVGSVLGETAILSILLSMMLGFPVDSTLGTGVFACVAGRKTLKAVGTRKDQG
jgi:hypothetical protein